MYMYMYISGTLFPGFKLEKYTVGLCVSIMAEKVDACFTLECHLHCHYSIPSCDIPFSAVLCGPSRW